MRVIKFRAWDESNKIIHFDVEFIRSGLDGNDWIIFKSDKQTLQDKKVLDNPYFQQQIKLMQYTGLKDKNGKEIYEGDIICALVGVELFTGVCEYIEKAGAFAITNEDELAFCNEYFDSQLEVIGNIYENSELLK